MHDNRFANDRISAAQAHLSLPIDMRFAGSIGLEVSEIAFVTFGRHRAAMLMLSRVKVRTRGGGIGRGAIALFMNVKPVLAWLQSSDVAHLDVVAAFVEHHR